MNIIPTSFAVADYCRMMQQREVFPNREYQRSDKVWPPAARSFLIETILLGFPIPKLSLYQVTDLKSMKTHKEIVDGQQRSDALLAFFEDRLKLPRESEVPSASGLKYSELSDGLKDAFLSAPLSVDLFVSAVPADIREVFRRINSYTVPLNPEESRHAKYQGEFKWFIYRLARRYDQYLVDIGVLTGKQVIRMQDTKLLTDIIYALINGLTTTKSKQLDSLYAAKDETFPEGGRFASLVGGAFETVLGWDQVHGTNLMKPHVFYSLVLALIHCVTPQPPLQDVYPISRPGLRNTAVANLLTLSAALDGEPVGPYKEFIEASKDKTNVREPRQKRFRWCCDALVGKKQL
jgi:hypothetical protein